MAKLHEVRGAVTEGRKLSDAGVERKDLIPGAGPEHRFNAGPEVMQSLKAQFGGRAAGGGV